jgi:hypothetical protein
MSTLHETGWTLDADAVARLADEGVEITRQGGRLVISIDEENPLKEAKAKVDRHGNLKASKSRLFATSHGLATIGYTSDGCGVYLSLNAGAYKEPRGERRGSNSGKTQADVDAAVKAALAQAQAQQQAAIDAAVKAALAQAAPVAPAMPASAPERASAPQARATGNTVTAATPEGEVLRRAKARRAAQQAAPAQAAPAQQKPQRPGKRKGKRGRLSLVD